MAHPGPLLARECQQKLDSGSVCDLGQAALLAIVVDHAQGKANSAFQPAHAMAQAGPVKSAAAFHWTIARGENYNLPLLGRNDLSFRLRPRLLFHNHEFAAFVVGARLAEKTRHLQWKGNGTIDVLVEAVEIAGLIVQQKRRCPCLAILHASLEKAGMVLGENVGQTESLIPLVGKRN